MVEVEVNKQFFTTNGTSIEMDFGQYNPIKMIIFSSLGWVVNCSVAVTLTYHIEYSLGSQLLVLVLMIRRDLTLELIELAKLHIFHEQEKLPWDENICKNAKISPWYFLSSL